MTNGTKVRIAGHEWTVLDQTGKGVICICEVIGEYRFDEDCNNWVESELRKKLNNNFLKNLEDVVGSENIIPFERDLMSLDGLKEYGKCKDKVSLINVDEYRKYREFLPNTGEWWWTLTPDSVAGNGDSLWVSVVSPRGSINYGRCYDHYGVRPFCIFNPLIFESEKVKMSE